MVNWEMANDVGGMGRSGGQVIDENIRASINSVIERDLAMLKMCQWHSQNRASFQPKLVLFSLDFFGNERAKKYSMPVCMSSGLGKSSGLE